MKLGIIGDIHEDVVALRDALNILEHAKCDSIVCLGDITGYKVTTYNHLDTRNAHECIAMVRANCEAVVIGNNDIYNIKKVPVDYPGFNFPLNWHELDYYERKNYAKESIFLYEDVLLSPLITKEDHAYLESLPFYQVIEKDNVRILLSHFAFPDVLGMRSYFPKTASEFQAHIEFVREQKCSIGVSGHMHFEGISVCDESLLKRNKFERVQLSASETQWVYGPCVARGRFNNGVMILDTITLEMEAIPMSKIQWINESRKLTSLMQTYLD